MKEINFLPEWYKNDRMEQRALRVQYFSLAAILLLLAVWNFVAAHSVSRAEAKLQDITSQKQAVENTLEQFNRLKGRVLGNYKKMQLAENLSSRLNVTAVLAELSYIVDPDIVLKSVDINARRFRDFSRGRRSLTLCGDARYLVEVVGESSSPGAAARFICDMEDSEYFFEVSLVYSKSAFSELTDDRAERQRVTSFKLNCYLANYKTNIDMAMEI
mgnify:CR=1 FL=1